MDAAIITVILQLIFLECVLSIDNAAVMGAMVASLPDDQPPPWPRRLRRTMRPFNRFLGPQREAALKVGLFGAYAGRILMLLLATIIIKMEWVQILGASYLFYLAIDHFADAYRHAPENGARDNVRVKKGFWYVVLALNFADMAFSLDNVVAAIALSDILWVVLVGVGIGILIIRFAATIFTHLISWEPAMEHAAYLLLFAIGAELLLDKLAGVQIGEMEQFAISVIILLVTILFARVRLFHPVLRVLRRGLIVFAAIQAAIGLIITTIQTGIVALFTLLLLPVRSE